jgi:hypothetical protein
MFDEARALHHGGSRTAVSVSAAGIIVMPVADAVGDEQGVGSPNRNLGRAITSAAGSMRSPNRDPITVMSPGSPVTITTCSARLAVPAPVQAPLRRRSRVRATQVHLDEIAEEHLTELRKRAVVGEVDFTASAVMRLALAELVERHGYDRIVRMFAEDDVRLRRGRPRS